jgi:4-amino-4-deoxy-L-arabinose transferase-like glycosyltransferase
LLIPAVVALVKSVRGRDDWMLGYLFAACWIGVYMGMFSLAKTKLPSYITPAYPALAMMVAALIDAWSRGRWMLNVWTPRLAFGTLAAVGLAICIALPLAAREFLPGEMWMGLFGLIPILAALAGYYFAVRDRAGWSAASIGACAALMLTLTFGVVAPRISRYQPVDHLLAEINASSDQPALAGHMAHEPSWVFYAGRTIPIIGHQDRREVGQFLRDPDAFVLTNERALEAIQAELPADVQIIARERCFLKKYNLVVLGRTRNGVRLARQNSDGATIR